MRQVDPITNCEACGAEMADMVDDLRRFRIMNPGKGMKMMLASLRAPFWCEECIATSGKLVKAAREEAGELVSTAK